MNRMNRRNRRHRGTCKDPERPSPSEQHPQPSSNKPARLLPPSLEKHWTADEVWALMTHNERCWAGYQFKDTPEYWKSIAALIPGSSPENLRNIHLAIVKYQDLDTLWNLDDLKTLLASFCGSMKEPIDKPEWWGEIASNFFNKTALDCRLAYNTFCLSNVRSKKSSKVNPQQQAKTQPSVPGGTKTDEASSSSQRTSLELPKTMLEGKQQHYTRKLSEPKITLAKQRTSEESPMTTFPGGASSQRTSVVPRLNWKLEDYMSLMTILKKNLHVDTDDAGAMESIAMQLEGKTGEEIRHLIRKWRPQLIAALEKADRIAGSSSGTKGAAMSR